jgi:hypothetical protein
VVRSEDDELEALRPGLEGPRDGRRDAQRVERSQVEDLVVELHAARAREHDADLLRLVVPVPERLALAGLDPVVREPRRLRVEGAGGEARLLRLAEAELDGRVLDVGQVLDRVGAHRAIVGPASATVI